MLIFSKLPNIMSGDGVAAHDVQEVVPAERHDGLQVGALELGALCRLQGGSRLQQSLNFAPKRLSLDNGWTVYLVMIS